MRFLQPPCLSGAAAMIIRAASQIVSAVAMFKWGGGDQVWGPWLLSLATCVEVGGKVLLGGLFHASQAADFPRCRPCLLGSERDATVPGSGPARPSPAVFALPTTGCGAGRARAAQRTRPGGSEGDGLSRRERRGGTLGWGAPGAGPHLLAAADRRKPAFWVPGLGRRRRGARSTDETEVCRVLGPPEPGDTSLCARGRLLPRTAHLLLGTQNKRQCCVLLLLLF